MNILPRQAFFVTLYDLTSDRHDIRKEAADKD